MRLKALEERLEYTLNDKEEVEVITEEISKIRVTYTYKGYVTFTKEFKMQPAHYAGDIIEDFINKVNTLRRLNENNEWTIKNDKYNWFTAMEHHFSNVKN